MIYYHLLLNKICLRTYMYIYIHFFFLKKKFLIDINEIFKNENILSALYLSRPPVPIDSNIGENKKSFNMGEASIYLFKEIIPKRSPFKPFPSSYSLLMKCFSIFPLSSTFFC